MSDRVEDAFRALRQRVSGETPDPEGTLQRVLAARAQARRVWAQRARMWIPLAAVLAFSTAALGRWGVWSALRTEPSSHQRAARVLATTPAPAVEPPAVAGHDVPAATAPAAAESAPRAAAVVAPVIELPRAKPPTALRAPPAPSAAATTAGELPPAPPKTVDATLDAGALEAAAYVRAHRLHFDGEDAARALAAWDDYLERFPAGTFVPEARYNRAIDLIKLRRYAEARAALAPFAAGTFAGYHQGDAQELLRALPAGP